MLIVVTSLRKLKEEEDNMLTQKNNLYHIHRNGNMDDTWQVGTNIEITDSFDGMFYKKLLEDDKILTRRYGNYDIDYIIAMMEEIKFNNRVEDDMREEFDRLLRRCYFLRREQALEEGRKIFAPDAPSRLHSIFLTDIYDLYYWKKIVGDTSFKIFLLELEGNLFVSSDKYFPSSDLMYDIQVERSQQYWKPKIQKLTPHKEFIFQGKGKIIK